MIIRTLRAKNRTDHLLATHVRYNLLDIQNDFSMIQTLPKAVSYQNDWTFSGPEYRREVAGKYEMEMLLICPSLLIVSHNTDFTAQAGYQATTIAEGGAGRHRSIHPDA